MELLTEADLHMLGVYVDKLDRWLIAKERTENDGAWYVVVNRDEQEVVKKAPWAKDYQELGKELLQLADHFGMTPSARNGLEVKTTAAQKDDFKDFLFGADGSS